ncbi:MAG TPA: inorganic phosphate transporter [Chitinivibrionales bacterium]|nr:inorganic phosphate transporter [Chitinivibrionales bacterium]
MISSFSLVVVIVIIALLFDFVNGFHDAANAIATVVVTRTLTPGQAVLMAGLANFIGYFTFGVAIAKTVGKGIVHIDHVTLTVVLAALCGAIIWNIITWLIGLPTSSSHALIGGLVGSGVAAAGVHVVIWSGVLKIVLFIVFAPFIGMLGAVIFTLVIFWIFRRASYSGSSRIFKYMQLVSSLWYSVGHGTNDAQKTMGVIALALFTGGATQTFELHGWVVFSCYTAIALGTIFGGWRIVKTMGTKISKIHAMEGFCAESAAALVLLGTAHFGIPVSTTHVIAGSIMGVGTVEQAAKVRWITARKILYAWLLTIPVAAFIAAISYFALAPVVGK